MALGAPVHGVGRRATLFGLVSYMVDHSSLWYLSRWLMNTDSSIAIARRQESTNDRPIAVVHSYRKRSRSDLICSSTQYLADIAKSSSDRLAFPWPLAMLVPPCDTAGLGFTTYAFRPTNGCMALEVFKALTTPHFLREPPQCMHDQHDPIDRSGYD